MMTPGLRLRARRVEKGLSLKRLAQLAQAACPGVEGLSKSGIDRFEKDEQGMRLEQAQALGLVLGVSVGYLVGEATAESAA
ncbi:MAG TPA: hypothetical protein VEJ18_16890 [Planctomycetota bacterium]|nr:hypothetical protein [Planctomycetota bacterium]